MRTSQDIFELSKLAYGLWNDIHHGSQECVSSMTSAEQ